jgi:hypothetical protein
VLTTIHGFSSPKIMPAYEKYRDGYFVSISDADRAPPLSYLATVYNGIDTALYPMRERAGDDLIFLGRVQGDGGDRGLSHGSPWRPYRGLRRLRPPPYRLQFLPYGQIR